MSRRSRGCFRCRQRRVKCDEVRPACQRCVTRNELCVGYRDDVDLIFCDQTQQVALKSQAGSGRASLPTHPKLRRSGSFNFHGTWSNASNDSGLDASGPQWFDPSPQQMPKPLPTENKAASSVLDKYVVHPCNELSAPGFLEHLPCLFQEVNVQGRYALRWAVQATGFADMTRTNDGDSATKAIEYYGRSLVALEKSLSEKGKKPDDYDLMTMVVLDVFESLFLPDESQRGTHAQAMAHILRLRGHEQFHDPRGWGLFRIAHHRLQKEQLAKRLSPMTESQYWLSGLSDDLPYAALETGILEISSVCDRARRLQRQLGDCSISREELTRLIQEMYSIDAKAAQWRQRPEWSFRTVSRKDIVGDEDAVSCLPETVELHRDIWMAYEWNYHRTARIILHQQLIESLEKGGNSYESPSTSTMPAEFSSWMESSTRTVQLLAEQVVSTAAQSLGDIDHIGICINDSPPQYQAVGAYLLLWPIKIIKDPRSKVDESQRRLAQAIFERIREVTKMRSHLGSLSII